MSRESVGATRALTSIDMPTINGNNRDGGYDGSQMCLLDALVAERQLAHPVVGQGMLA